MATAAINITLITLNASNMLLHFAGTCLLVFLHKSGLRNSQQVYLINLSVCEFLMNFLECFRRVTKATTLPAPISGCMETAHEYIQIVIFAGAGVVYYADIVYITFDRLLTVSFSLKYSAYWDGKKAKRMIYATWFAGLLSCLVFSLLYYLISYNWTILFFKFVFPIAGFSYLILVLVTYCTLFREHKKSYRMSRVIRHCRTRSLKARKHTTAMTVFWNSRFIVSVSIICNFFMFMLVPCLVYLIYGIHGNNQSDELSTCCWIAFAVSNIGDSFNYIFLTGSVKCLLYKQTNKFMKSRLTQYRFGSRQKTTATVSELCTKTVWVTNWHVNR